MPRIANCAFSVAALLGCAFAPCAHALEHITLKTGFAYDCTRHESVEGNRVRLYLGAAKDNYVDLAADQIVSVDVLPDPVPAAPADVVAAAPVASVNDLLRTAGSAHNIDVDLLASVVHAESNGRAHAISRSGAEGLMQLMPSTARQLGVNDSFAPDQNIRGGTAYLDALLTRYHDNLALALAAYNAGPAAVNKYHGIPPLAETRAYVVRILREFKRRKQAAAHVTLASR